MSEEIPKHILADEALRIIETAEFNGTGWMRIMEICKELDLSARVPIRILIEQLQEIAK